MVTELLKYFQRFGDVQFRNGSIYIHYKDLSDRNLCKSIRQFSFDILVVSSKFLVLSNSENLFTLRTVSK